MLPCLRRLRKTVQWWRHRIPEKLVEGDAIQRALLGRLLADQVKARRDVQSLRDVEFRVFSQWGDDGIIQYLTQRVAPPEKTFIEFGVGDYHESNTRFLLVNDNWKGFVMDGSERNVERIRNSSLFWRHDLQAKSAFVDATNVDKLLKTSGLSPNLGLLHIDLDGVDYWIWQAIASVTPVLLILEYNSVFGPKRAITVPYRPDFERTKAHPSNLYWGASLAALCHLSAKKGYAFLGCNSAGNNAYFVRRDHLGTLPELSPFEGYVESKFRESRGADGELTHISGRARLEIIRCLPVVNVLTGAKEPL